MNMLCLGLSYIHSSYINENHIYFMFILITTIYRFLIYIIYMRYISVESTYSMSINIIHNIYICILGASTDEAQINVARDIANQMCDVFDQKDYYGIIYSIVSLKMT